MLNTIVLEATKKRDLIELGALHISNIFQVTDGFSGDEKSQLMDMLLTLNTLHLRQDRIIKKELQIGDDYL